MLGICKFVCKVDILTVLSNQKLSTSPKRLRRELEFYEFPLSYIFRKTFLCILIKALKCVEIEITSKKKFSGAITHLC